MKPGNLLMLWGQTCGEVHSTCQCSRATEKVNKKKCTFDFSITFYLECLEPINKLT